MRLKTSAVLGLVAAGSLLLAACGSSSTLVGSTTSAAAASGGTAASAAPPRQAGRFAVPRASRLLDRGKIGVILPDTKSSARWETQDRPDPGGRLQGRRRRLRHPERQR